MGDRQQAEELRQRAERADELADTAELMGDPDGAARLRATAADYRRVAMRLFDE